MHYVVALGNPGEKYQSTRHNVGWQAVDACLTAWRLPAPILRAQVSGRTTQGEVNQVPLQVLYPETFMNHSGSAVAKFVPAGERDRLVVVHDDIDLPFGEVRIAYGRGAGGNNGVASIIQKLNTKDFVRIRIGVAPKSFWTGKIKRPAGGGPLERFVLKPFTPKERQHLPDIFTTVQRALETTFTDGYVTAMNRYNTKA